MNSSTLHPAPTADELLSDLNLVAGILDAVDALVVVLDARGHVLFFNHACETRTGFRAEEILGETLWQTPLIAPDEVEALKEMFAQVASGNFASRPRTAWLTRTGDRLQLEWSNFSRTGPDGTVRYVVGTAIDISGEAKLRESVMEAEARFQALLDTVPGAIIIIDHAGTVVFFSRGAERHFGWRAHEVVGSNVTMLMPEVERDGHDGYLSRYRNTGRPHIVGTSREVRGRRKDGSTFPMELAVSEYQDGQHYFVGYIQDITGRRDAERRMQELQTQLRRASQLSALGQIGSVLAHELNQPLTALTNYVETWRRTASKECQNLSPDMDALMQAAVDEAQRASETIANLRSLFSGKQPDLVPEAVADLIGEALVLSRVGHEETGVAITTDIAAGLPPVPMVRTQILEVLVNLLQNSRDALIEAGGGRIDIRCFREGENDIEIAVTDTGPGLDPTIIEELFEPFATTKPSGMGLGLAISRSIVEAHGGRLWTSEVPSGAAFHFSLPINQRG